ncbi:hypothetical protein J6590_038765 [Homalodisca vitripennis]|nr:hypothetical protein J6590_038765 [Homalodisca vitripennis]
MHECANGKPNPMDYSYSVDSVFIHVFYIQTPNLDNAHNLTHFVMKKYCEAFKPWNDQLADRSLPVLNIATNDDIDQCMSSLQTFLQAAVAHSTSHSGLVSDHLRKITRIPFRRSAAAPEAPLTFQVSCGQSYVSKIIHYYNQ